MFVPGNVCVRGVFVCCFYLRSLVFLSLFARVDEALWFDPGGYWLFFGGSRSGVFSFYSVGRFAGAPAQAGQESMEKSGLTMIDRIGVHGRSIDDAVNLGP